MITRPPPERLRIAVTSALATGIPLAAGELAGRLSLGLTAALGSVTALYFPASSWGYRSRALPVVALGAAGAATLGAAAGGNAWRTALAIAVVGFAATLLFTALLAPPPGPVPIIVCCAVATQLPADSTRIETRAALTLAGALFAYLLTMAGARQDRAGPGRRAVAGALDNLVAMLETLGTARTELTQHAAAREIRRDEVIVARDRLSGPLADVAAGLRRVFDTAVGYAAITAHRPPASAANQLRRQADRVVRRAYGRPVARAPSVRWSSPATTVGPTMSAGTLAAADAPAARGRVDEAGTPARPCQDAATAAWHRLSAAIDDLAVSGTRRPRPVMVATRDLLAEGLRPRSPAWPWAARCGLATSGAALLAIAAGIERPYWAPVAAAAVLEVRTARVAGQRSLQRTIGTSLGALAALALLAIQFPVWALIAIVTVLECGATLLNVANTALGSLVVTPCTLLLVEFAHPGQQATSLVAPRVLDTMLGVLVGFAAALSLWPRAAAHRLPHALADCVEATGVLLALSLAQAPAGQTGAAAPRRGRRWSDLGPSPPRIRPGPRGPGPEDTDTRRQLAVRHHVEAALAWLSELQTDAWNEPGETARTTWPAVVAARRLGNLVLAEPRDLHDVLRATPASPEAVRVLFDRLAVVIEGHGSPPPRDPPQLPPFPPLKHEFAVLVEAASPR